MKDQYNHFSQKEFQGTLYDLQEWGCSVIVRESLIYQGDYRYPSTASRCVALALQKSVGSPRQTIIKKRQSCAFVFAFQYMNILGNPPYAQSSSSQ